MREGFRHTIQCTGVSFLLFNARRALDEGSIRESFFADTFDRQRGCDYAGASPYRLFNG